MQRYCTELTERLLKSLDKEYNVVDMGAVVDVITALEKTAITKEVLEITRLGKYINELRRKTNNDALAKRAKDLVRRWRDMVLPSAHATPQPTPADTAPQALNGTKPQSPALRGLKPQSPALRGLKPHSPALKNLKPQSPLMRGETTPLKQVLSPALSVHSDHSRSPNPTPTKHHHHQHHHQQQQQQQQQQAPSVVHTAPTTRTTNASNHHRQNSEVSPKLGLLSSTVNHSQIEAVPRTHSSNKRLRKEDASPGVSPCASPAASALSLTSSTTIVKSIRGDSNDSLASRLEPSAKRPRLNGEISNFGSVSKFSDSYASNNNLVTSRGPTSSNIGSSRSLPPNQQVPSPRDHPEKSTTTERLLLSDVSTSVESSRDAADSGLPASGPKKRGRKKGSKSLKSQNLPEDRVKEKLASISRNPKLKTTQELLADLQARGSSLGGVAAGTTSDGGLPSRSTEPPSTEEILRSAVNDERPLSSRFLRSTREKSSSLRSTGNFSDSSKGRTKSAAAGSGKKRLWEASNKSEDGEDDSQPEDAEGGLARSKELTVEEILAKLPPLDLDAISWSDCEDDEEPSNEEISSPKTPKEIPQEDVDRLHGQCVEGLNGNFQAKIRVSSTDGQDLRSNHDDYALHDIRKNDDAWSLAQLKKKGVYRRLGGNEDDREFREWHEMLARPSYDGQTLHILPYVIID